MNRASLAAFVLALGVAVPATAQEPGQLRAAKDLYASARYDEALTVLNGLRGRDSVDRRSVEQYRSLCLLALGRATEAESAIAAVVSADPLFRPEESDTSPRVRSMFTDVRKRMLPDIVTSRYAAAKAAYDRRDWPAAEQQFRIVLSLIDDPDAGGRLGDLRLLAAGFLELSARAAAPPPEAPKPVSEPTPVEAGASPESSSAPAAGEGPEPGKIYGAADHGIVAPAIVRQEIPRIPAHIIALARPRGLLEVVIDEKGRVVSMAARQSIHPAYDAMLLSAARDWKYKPATFSGEAVRFRKLIQVTVQR
jgi:hypothetical protein